MPPFIKHTIGLCLIFFVGVCQATGPVIVKGSKPRLIVLTDIGTEPDDIQSLIRLLTYANDIDIEGLIASTSKHLPDSVHPDFIEKRIGAYGEALANLRVHDKRYPIAEKLLSVVRAADPTFGLEGLGSPGHHEQAVQLIIDAVDDDDDRPLWITIWGGAAVLAETLDRVNKSRSPEEVTAFVSKLRVYSISDQDDAGPWIRMMFPKLFWVSSMHAMTEYRMATWHGINASEPGSDTTLVGNQWLKKNIQNKGPLGALYPDVMFGMEGDTPSFLYLIPNGLGNPEYPNWGSWGGRYGQIVDFIGLWTDAVDDVIGIDGKPYSSNKATVWRWREAFQNDFAARMTWSVTDQFEQANHPPTPVLNGTTGLGAVTFDVCAGQPVNLSAKGSTDVDGNKLSYRWFTYKEVNGIYSPLLEISGHKGQEISAVVPVWEQPTKIKLPERYNLHVVLEVKDDGVPALTRYRRAILSVPTQGQNGCEPIKLAPKMPVTDFVVKQSHPGAYFTTGTHIGVLLDHPEARKVLEQYLAPMIPQMESSEQARQMTLHAVAHFNPAVNETVLEKIDEALAKIKPEK